MNVFKRIKAAFTPVDQPTNFPRLYFIPDTYEVHAPRRSANDSAYMPPAVSQATIERTTTRKKKREPIIRGFIRRKKQAIRQARDRAWEAAKAFGRSVVRWLAWRVFLPLSVITSFWVSVAKPAELLM